MKKSTMVSLVGAVVSLGALAVGTYLNGKETERDYALLDVSDDELFEEEISQQLDLYEDQTEEIEA